MVLQDLGRYLASAGYRFTTVTPATHQRVLARAPRVEVADLRHIFGWNVWFARTRESAVWDLLESTDCVEREGAYCRSRVRFATVGERLFAHSSFPTVHADSVFFGPDSYRFVRLIQSSLKDMPAGQTILDIGCGSGVGGIAAADVLPESRIVLTDINPVALDFARSNSALAGIANVAVYQSDVLANVTEQPSVIICNPPYMRDTQGRSYRDGGDELGSALSLRIVLEAMQGLSRGGRLVLYTGSAITNGEDRFQNAARSLLQQFDCSVRYEELDPDVFGEELDQPAYHAVDRIAAVGLTVTKF